MMAGETVYSGAPHPGTDLAASASPAGYYVGFHDKDGAPYSRETPYFKDFETACQVRLILSRLDHSEIVAMYDTLAGLGVLR